MKDYTIALLERFRVETEELLERQEELNKAEETLKETLDAQQMRLFCHVNSRFESLRLELELCGFLTGWRLAEGVRNELDTIPRFSIISEDEKRIHEMLQIRGIDL